MAHVRKALLELPKELDLQSFYDWVEEEEKIGTQAKKLIDSLISSSDEDISNKTSHIVLQISRKVGGASKKDGHADLHTTVGWSSSTAVITPPR